MKKSGKNNDTVRTGAMEAVFVTLICIIVFSGMIFMKLAPYIGEHIVEEQLSEKSVTESADLDNADAESE